MSQERLPFGGLTEMELDAIAERAAKKAFQIVYAEVGQSVLKKLGLACRRSGDRPGAVADR